MKYSLSYTLITRVTGFLARTVFPYRKTELNAMCDLLKNKRDIKILDYGCNTGYFLNIINKKYPSNNFRLCGADINPYALNYARKKYPGFTFFDLDENFFANEKFDVIILSHVLEHVKDREAFLANLKKILNKNGDLIVAIPQERFRGDCTLIQWFYNILRFRFENPHVVKLFYDDLAQLSKNHGLEIAEHVYTHVFFPFKSNQRRLDTWSLVARCKCI